MRPRHLHLAGLVFQALAYPFLLLWTRIMPDVDPWLVTGALGTLGSVLALAGALTGRRFTPLGPLGTIAALLAGVGWASWIVVALTSQPGDPVINITGLLAVPGLLLGVIAHLLSHRGDRRPRTTGALWFGLALLAVEAASMALTLTDLAMSHLYLALLRFAVAAWLVGRAHLSVPEGSGTARLVALTGGYVTMFGSIPVFGAGLTLVGVPVILVAGILEWRRRPGHS